MERFDQATVRRNDIALFKDDYFARHELLNRLLADRAVAKDFHLFRRVFAQGGYPRL